MTLPRLHFTSRLRAVLLASLMAAALLALPTSASAGPFAEVSIQDDQLLLGASQADIDANMELFRTFGIDRLRVSAFWEQIAPDPNSRQRPKGFDAANPAEPRYRFADLDRVVESAARHQLSIQISILTPAPIWATREPQRDSHVFKPDAAEFGAFSAAVAARYAPFVDYWGVGNEPNQILFLRPQSDKRGTVAPHIYRAMVQAAYPRIKQIDPTSIALVGELYGAGRKGRGPLVPIRPLRFLRALGCRDSKYRRIRRGRCKNFKPVPMDAVGHHPYQLLLAPRIRSLNKDDAAINDGRRLLKVIDRLVRVGAFKTPDGKRPFLYYTEFGYQTSPPDPFAGVSLAEQKNYLQRASFIAWATPRVRELNQFRLTDGALSGSGPTRFREFQSGLLFGDRRPKPSVGTFPDPFVISGNRFWGHVLPGGTHSVKVEHRRGTSGRFRTLARVLTTPNGYFNFFLRGRRPGQYRYRYTDPVGASGIVRVRR